MSTLFTRDGGDEFAVYTKTWAGILLHAFFIVVLLGFGLGFISLYKAFVAFAIFGAFFTLAGLWILASIPKLSRRVSAENGFLCWAVSSQGIKISRDAISLAREFPWSQVERIVLAERWHDIQRDEKSYSWRSVLIFLKKDEYAQSSFLELARARVTRSPDGATYVASRYPRREQQEVLAGLKRFTPSRVAVSAVDKVVFDWKVKEVRLFNAEGRPVHA